jgi:hypothetical protein
MYSTTITVETVETEQCGVFTFAVKEKKVKKLVPHYKPIGVQIHKHTHTFASEFEVIKHCFPWLTESGAITENEV